LHQTDRVKFVLLIQQKAEFVVVTGSLIDVLKSWTGNPSLQFRCIAAISSATTNPKWLLLLVLLLFAVPVIVDTRLSVQSLRRRTHQCGGGVSSNVIIVADSQSGTSALIVMDARFVGW
jgi:hypothetical protein